MDDQRYFRINISFLQPDKLSEEFSRRYSKELRSGEMYLGIRLNPTSLKQSAALNSLELAFHTMDLAKEELQQDFGEIELFLREFHYTTDYMKSIIDTDSRTLLNFIQDHVYPDRIRYKSNHSLMQKIRNVISG